MDSMFYFFCKKKTTLFLIQKVLGVADRFLLSFQMFAYSSDFYDQCLVKQASLPHYKICVSCGILKKKILTGSK